MRWLLGPNARRPPPQNAHRPDSPTPERGRWPWLAALPPPGLLRQITLSDLARSKTKLIGILRPRFGSMLPSTASDDMRAKLQHRRAGRHARPVRGASPGPVRQASCAFGQRMKAELLAALLHRPGPFSFSMNPPCGLDVNAQARLREFLADYNRRHGAPLLLSQHLHGRTAPPSCAPGVADPPGGSFL